MINTPSVVMLHLMKFSGLTLSGLAFSGFSEQMLNAATKPEQGGDTRVSQEEAKR
ncbi:hypothetical protein J9874_00977 [Duffyella gerundensis]|uniref:Putative membrane protein n=1 Tax=Duffyella gerundensis TaxID=1619313 RepID=A0A0U5GNR7_9GAMM|nr:hypothetical protein [Duffyella gerundensis]QTO55257.1 hypothetical protein J8I88_05165 [Duffyella gerundensis]UCB30452.1 hypothetical protein J9874_00977 [Duffyella gerundensis]CUU24705.1 putative membrane protein [Duffyella gerundensis]